ncbi:hypothetical protein AAFF_G00235580 [Aldrovandia affinis]|uniref:Uncharacterized protein n=1 Tax=Aldrovandia affinis TaxID=143900 RepID=A0AAD7SVC7_9TELE|nr:hypothetical protein AAFF_G00235580 [Aldrovandia affinis]
MTLEGIYDWGRSGRQLLRSARHCDTVRSERFSTRQCDTVRGERGGVGENLDFRTLDLGWAAPALALCARPRCVSSGVLTLSRIS